MIQSLTNPYSDDHLSKEYVEYEEQVTYEALKAIFRLTQGTKARLFSPAFHC